MGRVARYKKVKAFDPYSFENGGRLDLDTVGVWGLGDSGRKPKKRSKTSEKLRAMRKKKKQSTRDEFDVAADGDDFDLNDLVGSLKKEKPVMDPDEEKQPCVPPTLAAEKTKTTAKKSQTDKEEEKLLKKIEKQVEPTKKIVAAEGRMQGESKRAYNKRVRLETRQIIQRSNRQQNNPEKRQKKKDFLNNKRKKKRKQNSVYENESDNDESLQRQDDEQREPGVLLTGEQAVAARAKQTQVKFGEQAERPPVFKQLPRGAVQKQPVIVSKKLKAQRSRMSNDEIEAEQEAMDLMRRKVQAQYAAIKMKRRQAGDFHL